MIYRLNYFFSPTTISWKILQQKTVSYQHKSLRKSVYFRQIHFHILKFQMKQIQQLSEFHMFQQLSFETQSLMSLILLFCHHSKSYLNRITPDATIHLNIPFIDVSKPPVSSHPMAQILIANLILFHHSDPINFQRHFQIFMLLLNFAVHFYEQKKYTQNQNRRYGL